MLRLEGSICKGSASARSANFEAAAELIREWCQRGRRIKAPNTGLPLQPQDCQKN